MRKLLKIFLSILLIILAYLLMINLLPDEELSAGAKEWLQIEHETVPKEQNSYYLLWGLDAPVGVDMREYGEAVIAKIISAGLNESVDGDEYLPAGFVHSQRIKAVGIKDLCTPDKAYCIDEYRNDVAKLLTDGNNALLLQRYREMSSLSGYMNTTLSSNSGPLPRISPLMNAQRLHLASITASYVEGNQQTALIDLAADLRFCRMLLRDADFLVIRMVAISMISRNLYIYSQLLEMGQPSEDVIKAVNAIDELDIDERDFEQVMQGELKFSHQTLMSVVAGSENDGFGVKIVRYILPFRMKRMTNKVQEQYSKVAALESLPPSSIIQQSEMLVQELMPDWWGYIGDPLTSFVFAISAPDYPRYLLRHYDLNGVIRLLKLKALIKKEGVSKENIDTFIAASPYASAYPEEMVPVRWEAGEHALIFDSVMGDRANKHNRIYFWAH